MDSSLQRFREKFADEANGLLDRLEKDLLDLENKPADKDLIESAFRAMHTIKGVSGMFGFDFISEFTHHMESIYQSIRENALQFNKEICEITLQSIDHLRKLLNDEKLADPSNQTKHNQLLDTIFKIVNTKVEAEVMPNPTNQTLSKQSQHTWHILLRTSDQMYFRGVSLVNIFKDLSAIGKFQVTKMEDMSHDDIDTWSVLLHTAASEDDIKEIFMFIEDDCTIADLTEGDLFSKIRKSDDLAPEKRQSMLDLIEEGGKQVASEEINIAKAAADTLAAQKQLKTTKRISVDSAKLDHLMYLVSELITVNSQLNLTAKKRQIDAMKPYLEKVDNLAKNFRNNAIEIRLVPLSDTVLRFQRLIRDLSKQLDKRIEFATQGTNTELDKNTIDLLAEPLMHLVRNCIDHGIETPAARQQKGKPEHGTITLTAYNSGNHVFITISDDGNGIDLEKVRLKAVDKGILKPTDRPDKKEIYDLLFRPGFSTAASLTEVSGRGVGMDIVKKRINDLRGEIIVESTPGEGTTFTLKLQQSLSIIDTLLFKVHDDFFTVPISEIDVCVQMKRDEIDARRHTGTLPYNNHLIPFVDLRNLFNSEGAYPKTTKVVIIRSSDRELALLTDKIVGEHQAVLKPLGKSFRNQQHITAASQLGDGAMAFMLDTNALIKDLSGQKGIYKASTTT